MDDVEAVSARGGVAQADAQLADVGFGGMELAPLADSLWEQVCGFMCLHAYLHTYVHTCIHNMCVPVDDCVHEGVVHTMCTLRVMALRVGHSVKMGDCTSLHICKMDFTIFSPLPVSIFCVPPAFSLPALPPRAMDFSSCSGPSVLWCGRTLKSAHGWLNWLPVFMPRCVCVCVCVRVCASACIQ